MTPWQKRARMAVAAVGLASAVVVYAGIGHRRAAPASAPLRRLDPKAILETTSGLLQQVRGMEQDFTVSSERQLTYQDGSTRLLGARISVQHREGRDFTVTAKEAFSADQQKTLRLSGDIHLLATDGFELTTDRASFTKETGVVATEGAVAFKRGGMHGTGTGMTYNENSDVLSIAHDAQVTVTDAAGRTTMDFHAGSASLDRVHDVLVLDGMVHVMRAGQVIDTDHANAYMSERDEFVKWMELRGNSRVEGGDEAFDSMSARDINLVYSEDGSTLHDMALSGGSAIAMAAKSGSAGRQFTADSLGMAFAPDGSVEKAAGQKDFRMVLPATADLPARTIQADQFDAQGEAGKGMTGATFTGSVVYREEPKKADAPRIARARQLRVAMMGDAIRDAVFIDNVTFEERGLKAAAGEARYDPDGGALALARGAKNGVPRVTDDRIKIEADAIDVALDTRNTSAKGNVKTTLLAGGSADGSEDGPSRLPGLLKQDTPANVNADAVEYDAAANRALYTGNASLWQGDTAIRADRLAIDQGTGDLVATGNARSSLALDTGTSVSRADEIRYDDAKHLITYVMTKRAPGAPGLAQMNGDQGSLTANHIEAYLAEGGGQLDRLEANGSVTMKLDTRTATGGRLTYHADTGQYDMFGSAAAPVKVVESCRETTGKTLTFFKSTDRIIVDGNEEIRTQTKRGGTCPQPAPR